MCICNVYRNVWQYLGVLQCLEYLPVWRCVMLAMGALLYWCKLFISSIREKNDCLYEGVVFDWKQGREIYDSIQKIRHWIFSHLSIHLIIWIVCCRLEEEGVLTDCTIKTLEPDEVLDFNFCSTNVINKIIMKVSSTYHISLSRPYM